ncbi:MULTISPECIES: hypothetical protein [Rhizobium]|uniref:hypothetical protein n=1 Tax=Rhizobium phaseoli TaxID=396 RepID=UPI0003008EC9|nr:hypothetical protein [Rhizobium phaseoli]ARM12080.1 hypothetical protein Bra5_CH01843 [Rhizobium phaseoli Brasil 5]
MTTEFPSPAEIRHLAELALKEMQAAATTDPEAWIASYEKVIMSYRRLALAKQQLSDRTMADAQAPQRPVGHCDDDAAWNRFYSDYEQYTRSDLAMGALSDFALANAQFLCDRNELSLIAYQTAAKERIRWLSIQLAKAAATASEGRVHG